MKILALLLALVAPLLTGVGTNAVSAAPEGDRPDSLAAAPARPHLPSWNLMPTRSTRGQVWANLGYGRISQQYGPNNSLVDAGDVAPLPTSLSAMAAGLGMTLPLPPGVDGTVQGASARISGAMDVLNLHVGGSYAVVNKPAYALALGANVGFSQQHFAAEKVTFDVANATVSIPAMGVENAPLTAVAAQLNLQIPEAVPTNQTVESGFRAQSVMLFAELRRTAVSARFGYQIDVGPSPDLSASLRENTDRQNAFLVSLAGREAYGNVIAFGGLDAYLTQDGNEYDRAFDRGDLYGVSAGLGFGFGFGEIGAALTFRYHTDGDYVTVFEGQTVSAAVPAGYHLGIAPYVSVSPRGASYALYAKGGVQDEYRDYTLSLSGENDFAPHVGFTFGLVYGL